MQQLTDPQIEALYKFTRKHYVEWYDVQIELVDHLANGIENQWIENPNLSFESALATEFKKFGIFGFSDVIEQKTKSLNTFYRKEIWKYFKDFFRLPKIIATLFSIWVFFVIIDSIDNKLFVTIPFVLSVFIICLAHTTREKRRINDVFKKTGKKWLIDNAFLQLGGLIHLLNLGVIYDPRLFESDKDWGDVSKIILSVCIVLYMLLFYVSIKIVEPKLKEKLSKEFPEYKLINSVTF